MLFPARYVFSISVLSFSLSYACWIFLVTHFCWWFGGRDYGSFKQLKRLSFPAPLEVPPPHSFIIVSKESPVVWILKGEKTSLSLHCGWSFRYLWSAEINTVISWFRLGGSSLLWIVMFCSQRCAFESVN